MSPIISFPFFLNGSGGGSSAATGLPTWGVTYSANGSIIIEDGGARVTCTNYGYYTTDWAYELDAFATSETSFSATFRPSEGAYDSFGLTTATPGDPLITALSGRPDANLTHEISGYGVICENGTSKLIVGDAGFPISAGSSVWTIEVDAERVVRYERNGVLVYTSSNLAPVNARIGLTFFNQTTSNSGFQAMSKTRRS